MLQIEKILERIALTPDIQNYKPTLETLKLLMKHYLLYVPYENLDFVLNKEFSANILNIYEKIVCNNRGGICYESNTLFAYLLKTLGFSVQMILAKVEDLTYIGYDYPHLALLVKLENEEYLVDVANGQNVREPMPLHDENYISVAENNEYKIRNANEEYVLLINHKHKGWHPRYHFTKEVKRVADFAHIFEGKNYEKFSNHAPLLVTRALKDGRVTLTNNTVHLKKDGEKKSWEITEKSRNKILNEYFDINLNKRDSH